MIEINTTSCILPSEIKSPKRYIDIGSSFKNFHSCLKWDQFQDMEGKFVTKKSTDSTPYDIQKLQLSLQFRLGEPINKYNIGRIIPAMERHEPQRKYILPMAKTICNTRRFSSPGLSLDPSIRKRNASLLGNSEENSQRLDKGDDVASLKIGSKLSTSANARVSNDYFHPENTSTPKNKIFKQNVTALETGLQLSSSENNRSFPERRDSLQPSIAAGTLKGHHHNQFDASAGFSKEQDRSRLAASAIIFKDHNQLVPSSAEISKKHHYDQLAESDKTSKECFRNQLATTHRILKGHIINRIAREQRHNPLVPSAKISKEYHHNRSAASSEIPKERHRRLLGSTGISGENKFTASAKISREFHRNRISASTNITKEHHSNSVSAPA